MKKVDLRHFCIKAASYLSYRLIAQHQTLNMGQHLTCIAKSYFQRSEHLPLSTLLYVSNLNLEELANNHQSRKLA